MKLKLQALALVATLMAAPAFAADIATDIGTIGASTDLGADLLTTSAAAMAEDIASPAYDALNVAYVAQDGNYALIDQNGAGTGNFAAINQSAAAGLNVGVIAQNGNGNRAFINQHD
jgi:hypothetical protein